MRHVALLLAALCLLATPTGAVASAAGPVDSPGNGSAAVTTPFDDTQTSFVVSLRENGDARWTVSVAYHLEDERSRNAFDTYAEAYETDGSTIGPSADAFRNAAAAASNATGREMTVENVNRTAEFENETTGVLRIQFTWTNFLESQSDGTLTLGDVFVTAPEETWFRTLEPGQQLVIEPPSGYTSTDVDVGTNYQISDRNIVVSEPATFAAGDISVTYEPSTTTGLWEDSQVLLGSAGLLVLLVAAAYLVSRRREGGTGAESSPPAGPQGPGTAHVGDGASVSSGDGADPSSEAVDGTEPEPDPDLLSDEERVERLLDRNGGRMRQADIVTETGWSDAKVSQLLSAMAEDGDVEKLRLGRENLISLPDGEAGDADDETGEAERGNGSGSGTDFGL